MAYMSRSHQNRVAIPVLESTPDLFFEAVTEVYDGGIQADARDRWYAPTNSIITLPQVSTYARVTKWTSGGDKFHRQAALFIDNHGLTGTSWEGSTDAGTHTALAFGSGKTVTLAFATSSPGPYFLERAEQVKSMPAIIVPTSYGGASYGTVTKGIFAVETSAAGAITAVRVVKQGEYSRSPGSQATQNVVMTITQAQGGTGATLTGTLVWDGDDSVYNVTAVAVTAAGTGYGSTGSNFIEFLHGERVSNVTTASHTYSTVDCNLFYPMELYTTETNHRIKQREPLVPYNTSSATYSPFSSRTQFYWKVINADTLLLRDTHAGYSTFDTLAAAEIGSGEYPSSARFRPDRKTTLASISIPLHPDLKGIMITATVNGKYRFRVDAGDRVDETVAASNYQRLPANTPTHVQYNLSTFFSDFSTKFPFKPVVTLQIENDSGNGDFYWQYVAG